MNPKNSLRNSIEHLHNLFNLLNRMISEIRIEILTQRAWRGEADNQK